VLNRLALLALGAWSAEARLFASGLRLPAVHPESYAAAVDRRRLASVIVMEDVTLHGGGPVDPARPLAVAQAESGLRGLAALHAAYWDRPAPDGIGPWRLGPVWAPVSWASLANGRRKLEALEVDHPRLDSRRLERQFRSWATIASSGPQTLLHGDPHPGNTYTLPGDALGFYDWQLVRTGSWAHDVGYFIGAGLDTETRRSNEHDLLAEYLAELERLGVEPPTRQHAWDLYAQTPAFGLATWLHALSGGGFQPVDVCLATIDRFAASYYDHRL
jgi:aminoglycoside phosphotransferase (APT) family kinase protein